MTRVQRILWFFLRGLGLPEGQPSSVYQDIALGIVFVPAAIVLLLNLHLRQFGPVFWGALAIVGVALLFAPRHAVLVGALCTVVAGRFLIGFVLTFDYRWLLGAGACLALIIVTVRLSKQS